MVEETFYDEEILPLSGPGGLIPGLVEELEEGVTVD